MLWTPQKERRRFQKRHDRSEVTRHDFGGEKKPNSRQSYHFCLKTDKDVLPQIEYLPLSRTCRRRKACDFQVYSTAVASLTRLRWLRPVFLSRRVSDCVSVKADVWKRSSLPTLCPGLLTWLAVCDGRRKWGCILIRMLVYIQTSCRFFFFLWR